MKLYTEEQVRELLSNMLLTTEQVESVLKELSPQDPAILKMKYTIEANSPYNDGWTRELYKEELEKIDK